jgi:DNA topoisomerase-3
LITDILQSKPKSSQVEEKLAKPKSPQVEATPNKPQSPQAEAKQADGGALGACPRCQQGELIPGRQAWGCSRWREGCHTMIPYVVEGAQIAPSEAKKLLARGSVRLLEPFHGPQGPFLGEIRLHLDQGASIVAVVPTKVSC